VTARVVMVMLLVAVVVVPGLAVAWVMAPASAGPSEQRVDAVIALAGDSARLRAADEIAGSTGGELVLSWVPGSSPVRDARCMDQRAELRCFLPDPVNTAGEARAIGQLSGEQGWKRIVVVTSRHHVGRARMLVGQCVGDAEFYVASATDRLAARDVLEESMGVLVGATLRRAC
jgi:uncharacterized SAM-binding protein YcdF (DUF218 family)